MSQVVVAVALKVRVGVTAIRRNKDKKRDGTVAAGDGGGALADDTVDERNVDVFFCSEEKSC